MPPSEVRRQSEADATAIRSSSLAFRLAPTMGGCDMGPTWQIVSALRRRPEPNARISDLFADLEGDADERSAAFVELASPDLLAQLEPAVAAAMGCRLFRSASGGEMLAAVLG